MSEYDDLLLEKNQSLCDVLESYIFFDNLSFNNDLSCEYCNCTRFRNVVIAFSKKYKKNISMTLNKDEGYDIIEINKLDVFKHVHTLNIFNNYEQFKYIC